MSKIKILLIEPNAILRKGLTVLLNERVDLEVTAAHAAMAALDNESVKNTDILLTDITSEADFEKLWLWRMTCPQLKIIVFSSIKRLFENYLLTVENKNLANAFLSKEVEIEELVETLKNVPHHSMKEVYMVEDIKGQLFGHNRTESSIFSEKELCVLKSLGKGRTTKETASLMNLSVRTIETHRRRMMEKLGTNNIIPVILYALEKNYIKPEIDYPLTG